MDPLVKGVPHSLWEVLGDTEQSGQLLAMEMVVGWLPSVLMTLTSLWQGVAPGVGGGEVPEEAPGGCVQTGPGRRTGWPWPLPHLQTIRGPQHHKGPGNWRSEHDPGVAAGTPRSQWCKALVRPPGSHPVVNYSRGPGTHSCQSLPPRPPLLLDSSPSDSGAKERAIVCIIIKILSVK